MADHRPDVYERDDGTMVFRVSSFAACDRRLIAAGQGHEPAPPPEKMLEVFKRGQDAEWEILTALGSRRKKTTVLWRDGSVCRIGYNILDPKLEGSYRKLGESVLREPHDGQFTVELELGDGMVAYGHLDGVGSVYLAGEYEVATDTALVLEAKRFGPDNFAKWQAEGMAGFPWYVAQTDLYMHATGCECLFLVGEGVETDDGHEVKQVWAELKSKPSRPLAFYKSRARRLRAQIETGVLPEECPRGVEYPCPYWTLHADAGKERIDLMTREPNGQIRRIAELAAMVYQKGRKVKALNDEMAPLRAELRDLVVAVAGVEGAAVLTEHYDITHTSYSWPEKEELKVTKAGKKDYVTVKERKKETDS